MTTAQYTVTSQDGTTIAYEETGTGPVLILVGAALSDRSGHARLAPLLTPTFTVINYDRRGRGGSGDTPPYAVQREVEDIAALVDDLGGSAYLFGSSSGAVLALDAVHKLGDKVTGVFLYEPPFIVDSSRPPMPRDLAEQIDTLVANNRRNAAVKLFFTKGMGIPGIAVTLMRLLMPVWSKMTDVAHTITYDLAILEGTQNGTQLPRTRWSAVHAPTLVMVGSKSEPFFHSGARELATLLPAAQYRALEGGSHATVLMAPQTIAAAVNQFFLST